MDITLPEKNCGIWHELACTSVKHLTEVLLKTQQKIANLCKDANCVMIPMDLILAFVGLVLNGKS